MGAAMIFFFNDTATTEIYTLSLHDALPISFSEKRIGTEYLFFLDSKPARKNLWEGYICSRSNSVTSAAADLKYLEADRKSTRLNSSHANISYAVFCLKNKHL